jgi:hypothetical protein
MMRKARRGGNGMKEKKGKEVKKRNGVKPEEKEGIKIDFYAVQIAMYIYLLTCGLEGCRILCPFKLVSV